MLRADFIGVYSKKIVTSIAFSQSSSRAKKQLFFTWKTTDGRYFSQAIDNAYNPIDDEPQQITSEDFVSQYAQEIRILVTPVTKFEPPALPASENAKKKKSEEVVHVEVEEQIPEEQRVELTLRQKFARELNRLQNGLVKEATLSIEKILATTEGIINEHMHMFTDFGIALRKILQYRLALLAFERAYSLAKENAAVLFNLARIHFEMKHFTKAHLYIDKSLAIEPDNAYAQKFRTHLVQQHKIVLNI